MWRWWSFTGKRSCLGGLQGWSDGTANERGDFVGLLCSDGKVEVYSDGNVPVCSDGEEMEV